jgi:hypothetical protein
LVYNNAEEGRCLVLRIESLEIDDHILDKIESKHSVSFQEVERSLSIRETTCQEKQGRVVQALQPDGGWTVCLGSSGKPGER